MGRPTRGLREAHAQQRSPVLALDIGGTKLAAGVVTAAGEVLSEVSGATDPSSTPSDVTEALLDLGNRSAAAAGARVGELEAVGISFGGPVDHGKGVVITCHHLAGWEGVPLREIVSGRMGLPAAMDNDANAAALGEAVFGAGRGCSDLIYITVSTGIGAGLVVGGKVHRGANSMAGELGHTHLVPYGPKCTCGRLGCLESVAAGWAIVREAAAALDMGAESALRSVPRGELSAKHVMEMAQTDALAARVVARAGEHLGLGIARAVNLLNPEVVAIGGGISQAGEVLMGPVRRGFARYVMPELAEGMRLTTSELAPRWGLLGAAALAVREATAG
ncbi:MAG: ROK family protein [Armatimonadota bacterium]